MKNIPTLYEWVGDIKTFETLFSRFYINSQLTENPMDTNEPMPRWGWEKPADLTLPDKDSNHFLNDSKS